MNGLIPFGISLAAIIVGILMICLGMGTRETTETKDSFGCTAKGIKITGERTGLLVLGHLLIWPSIVFAIIYGIVFLALFLTSWGQIKALEAFYRDTLANYAYSVTATEQVEIQGYANQEGVITDLTYQQQGMVTGERIKEMRDKTEWYNRTLRRLESANGVPVIGWLFHDVPDDLQPIVLER